MKFVMSFNFIYGLHQKKYSLCFLLFLLQLDNVLLISSRYLKTVPVGDNCIFFLKKNESVMTNCSLKCENNDVVRK